MHDLRDEVEDKTIADQIAVDWRTADLDPADAALCEYTEKLTTAPASVGAEEIAALRAAGFDDRAISSATQVVAYFNYINRIAEGLGVPMEDWLDEDGTPLDL
ncbi:MAG TPA: hypothetical protein VK969_00290 [Acidimicrobiia bacterium]|nr:hypothetical protein [Acidimicrobiia bacterium]